MHKFLLSFANSETRSLQHLREEDQHLYESLLATINPEEVFVIRESFVSSDSFGNALIRDRRDLWLIHFGGHADENYLDLEDTSAHGAGIAELAGQCPNLTLFFLNGCATGGHVKSLLSAGVSVVIATSAPVDDKKAAIFSRSFYEGLGEGMSIKDAFERAQGILKIKGYEVSTKRHVREIKHPKEATWGLFAKEGQEDILLEPIPGVIPQKPKIYFSNAAGNPAIDDLFNSLKYAEFRVVKDKKEQAYGSSISKFIQEVGEGKLILLFLSSAFFKDLASMSELLEIQRNSKDDKSSLNQRILTVRMEPMDLGDFKLQDRFQEHWKKEEQSMKKYILKWLDDETLKLSQAEKYLTIRKIRRQVGELMNYLEDIQSASIDTLSQNDFYILKQAIREKLGE